MCKFLGGKWEKIFFLMSSFVATSVYLCTAQI